jgi:hypothetical protein
MIQVSGCPSYASADSGVKRNILGCCGNALAMNDTSGWQERYRAGRI